MPVRVSVPVVVNVGETVALPGDGVNDGEAVRLTVGDWPGVPGTGVRDGETVRLAVGDELGVNEEGVSRVAGVLDVGVDVEGG